MAHSHSSLEALVKKHGGSVTRSVTKATTHVVCTEQDYNDGSSKVTSAKAKKLLLVSPAWLFETDEQDKKLDPNDFTWESLSSNGTKTNDATDATANGSKKRVVKADNEDEDEEQPKSKRTKGTKATAAKAPKVSKASQAKAAVKDEPEENTKKDTKDEKIVAEGQFIKKKDVSIPLDEYCPDVTYSVYVEPDSGLIFDASLNQSNSAANNNKFYRIQVGYITFPHYK